MATRTTAKTTAKTNTNECVIKCNPHRELACGYTKVKIMPRKLFKNCFDCRYDRQVNTGSDKRTAQLRNRLCCH